MSDHGTPRPTEPGVVVRIRVAGCAPYVSRRMTLEDAQKTATLVKERFRRYGEGLLDMADIFPALEYEDLAIHGSRVIAVEVRRLDSNSALIPPATPEPAGATS